MELLEIYFLACLAMFFPLLLVVVVLALNTSKPVPILTGFLAGGLLTTISVGSAMVFAFQGSSFLSGSRPPADPWVDLVVGSLALVAALVLRGMDRKKKNAPPNPAAAKKKSRSSDLIERLVDRGAPLAFVAGILGTIIPGPGPIIAMKNIAELDYSTSATLVVIVSFYVIMFTFVEVPLVGFVVAEGWTRKNVAGFNAWLGKNLLWLASWALGVVGVVEIVRGIFAL
ncbi:MAG TPA: GAP family protein [Gaiellaceae bacterium]|nr:GAP family protein [Gaiellaceae bacterium]